MKGSITLGGGLAGACALTLIHETVKRVVPQAPRMDLLGMNAISKMMRNVGQRPPRKDKLFWITMAGDLLSNALYYSLIGVGNKKNIMWKGTALGLAAGLGGVFLPKPMGLNPAPSSRTTATSLMTVGLYLLGGVIAAAAIKQMDKEEHGVDEYDYAYH